MKGRVYKGDGLNIYQCFINQLTFAQKALIVNTDHILNLTQSMSDNYRQSKVFEGGDDVDPLDFADLYGESGEYKYQNKQLK